MLLAAAAFSWICFIFVLEFAFSCISMLGGLMLPSQATPHFGKYFFCRISFFFGSLGKWKWSLKTSLLFLHLLTEAEFLTRNTNAPGNAPKGNTHTNTHQTNYMPWSIDVDVIDPVFTFSAVHRSCTQEINRTYKIWNRNNPCSWCDAPTHPLIHLVRKSGLEMHASNEANEWDIKIYAFIRFQHCQEFGRGVGWFKDRKMHIYTQCNKMKETNQEEGMLASDTHTHTKSLELFTFS